VGAAAGAFGAQVAQPVGEEADLAVAVLAVLAHLGAEAVRVQPELQAGWVGGSGRACVHGRVSNGRRWHAS